jgi:hypothetical protein
VKAVKRERAKLSEMTAHPKGWQSIPCLIATLTRQLKGWMNYFKLGSPRKAFGQFGHDVRCRMIRHLRVATNDHIACLRAEPGIGNSPSCAWSFRKARGSQPLAHALGKGACERRMRESARPVGRGGRNND